MVCKYFFCIDNFFCKLVCCCVFKKNKKQKTEEPLDEPLDFNKNSLYDKENSGTVVSDLQVATSDNTENIYNKSKYPRVITDLEVGFLKLPAIFKGIKLTEWGHKICEHYVQEPGTNPINIRDVDRQELLQYFGLSKKKSKSLSKTFFKKKVSKKDTMTQQAELAKLYLFLVF